MLQNNYAQRKTNQDVSYLAIRNCNLCNLSFTMLHSLKTITRAPTSIETEFYCAYDPPKSIGG